MSSSPIRSLAGVARVVWAMADKDAANLDRIEKELEAGNDVDALTLMRDYFHVRKQPMRDGVNESETAIRTTKVRA